MKKATTFSSFGGYRRFCGAWWNDLFWYVIGISGTNHWNREESWWKTVRWRQPGWVNDIVTFCHRGRYGWAPRDTWSLDYYMNRVLSGALVHLADTANGAPAGYGMPEGAELGETNFEKWDADLRRWAKAFSEDPQDVDIYDKPEYVKHRAEEERRRTALHEALREMEPIWEGLWN